MIHLYLAILEFPANPILRFVLHVFRRDPFRGIYEPNAFDLSILIPYFTILIVLSIFGIHRYFLVFTYLRNKRKGPRPADYFDELPRVTVQLPIYNERYVVERLLEAILDQAEANEPQVRAATRAPVIRGSFRGCSSGAFQEEWSTLGHCSVRQNTNQGRGSCPKTVPEPR